jgi:hypothetical protein
MKFGIVLLAATAALLAGGCKQDDSAVNGVFFPHHSVRGPTPMAVLDGRLEVAGGCIWIVAQDGRRLLPIWPPGSHVRIVAERLELTDDAGRVLAADGDRVAIVGGETVTADNARGFMGRVEPTACRPDAFWLVGTLRSEGRASPAPSPTDGADGY